MQQVRVVAVGHVDHGKSTLIGRLLHDTGNLPDGKVAEMKVVSERRGVHFEWSFVLDAMQSERDQAVTIDTTRIWLRTPERDVVLIDAPGHKEFLRNMVTGASDADAAMLLVDAHEGVSEQTRRHALLLELIGVRRVVVVINKMDLVDYDATRYGAIREELGALLERIGIEATQYVPISARSGENVTERAPAMAWYDGPTVLAAILALPVRDVARGTAFRMAVQGTIRRDLQRIVVGRVESGSVAVGDAIAIAPSMRVAHVASIDVWPPDGRTVARAGESVGITLDGKHFVDRGDVIAAADDAPTIATAFRARLLWLGTRALEVGDTFGIRFGTRTSSVRVRAFERVVDIDALAPGDARRAHTNDVAEVVFESREALALDTVAIQPGLARFILLDGVAIVAGGTILAALGGAANNVVPVGHLLDRTARERRNGHRGAVLWLTGLPGAGKSTIAMELERRLFERGLQTYVLDGDNLRLGLNADLGFSSDDRRENIRRVAEVAALFADAGTIAIAAFISPARADRERARAIAGEAFVEVYVEADAATCEARDPKGHYKRARAGAISGFTGIDDSYEIPERPDVTLDTDRLSPDEAVETLLAYVRERIVEPARSYANANL
ncbi:MAG: adenylyl-sulfate kinase [Vulcanimicrobiaceae bacterium]